MAEIINYNPEDNPRLNEIYQILLLAGYFRIRIASLKAFDKVVGGIAWCITSSNFEIEVEYNDEMQIGQKIKVSQKICDSLQKMKCPYNLQPFQLQGLDVNNIFPIVQWLVKFVYETRQERQKYDRQLSMFLGKPITKMEHIGNPEKIPEIPLKRGRINRTIVKTSHSHPLRVYSALLQFSDPTATKMYNKLLNILSNKKNKNKKQKSEEAEMTSYLLQEQNEDTTQKTNELQQFSGVNKLSYNKLEQIIQENKNQLEIGLGQQDIIEQNITSLRQNLGIKQSVPATVPDSDISKKVNEQQKILKQAKVTNQKYLRQIQAIQKQIESFEGRQSQLENQLAKLQKKHDKAHRITSQEIQKNNQYRVYHNQVTQQLKDKKNVFNSRLEKLVEKRQELKIQKTEIKKKAKTTIQELQYQKSMVYASIPEIDEEAFTQMMKQAELKKQIYSKKYEELTLVNQELAILQRKAQKYTSPAEIAQYHQRFIELFESINVLIEEKRSYYSEMQNSDASKKVINNYFEIMNNMKDGYRDIKKKSQLKDLIENTSDIMQGLKANLKNSQATLAKIQSKRESVYGELMDLIKLQREYLTVLRELKLQYENATKIDK